MGIKVNYYLYEHDVFPARRTASVSLTRNTFIDWFFASDRITYVHVLCIVHVILGFSQH